MYKDMMTFDIPKIVSELKQDKEKLENFLRLAAFNYMYDLDQLLILYSQGYKVDEELCGYDYMQQKQRKIKGKYSCLINSQSVYLYPVLRKLVRRRETKIELRSNRALSCFKNIMGVNAEHAGGMQGYTLTEDLIKLDLSKPYQVIENLIQAYLDICNKDFTSLFCKEIVEFMWFGKEDLKIFTTVQRLTPKDFYVLLNCAFQKFQEIYYFFHHKYFTINEIGILNMCYECDTKDEVFMTLASISGVTQVLTTKLYELNTGEMKRLIETIKEEKLVNYPEYEV